MTVKIGGVPEHFNYPWQFALEMGLFSNAGIDVKWIDFPGGTGAMSTALRNKELDIAILLTEGAIKEISNGADFRIIKVYVESPLIWGIHTSSTNRKASLEDLKEMKYAISRRGSGSHLMSFVHAKEHGQAISDEQMIVINDLPGALASLKEEQTDLFFWEKFTTKPFVETGALVRLGEFPSPWPCFVIVAHTQLLSSKKDVLYKILSILDESIHSILSNVEATQMNIVQKYKLAENDVKEWLSQTKWSTTDLVSENMLSNTQTALETLGLSKRIQTSDLVYNQTILN